MAVDLHRNATSIHKGRYIQATDPTLDGTVADGVEWLDTSGTLPVAKWRAAGAWVTLGILVPPGGSTGQALVKASGADFDVEWGAGGSGGGGGGDGFAETLTVTSGLTEWHKADAGVYADAGVTPATNGGTVQQWNDESGSGNHATQATSGNRPSYYATGYRGKPVLRGDAVNRGLRGQTLSTTPHTIVISYLTRSNGTGRAISGGATNYILGTIGDKQTLYVGSAVAESTYAITGEMVTLAATNSGSLQSFYYNGGLVGSSGSLLTPPGSLNYFGFGGAFADSLNGDIAEVLVYNRVLTDAELAEVDRYMYERWRKPS